MAYKKGKVENNFTQIPEGWYDVYVSAFDLPESYQDGEKTNVNYKIREDLHPDFKGREVRYDFVASSSNMRWKTDAILDAMGVEDDQEFNSFMDVLKFMKHKPLRIKIENEEYNGKVYAKAKGWDSTEHPDFTVPEPKSGMDTDTSSVPSEDDDIV